MRIRKLVFRDFRSFRGRREISFVDPLTDTVRPVTVLAGSNGSGKTTVLEVIGQLLTFVVQPEVEAYPPIVRDITRSLGDPEREGGLLWMTLELFPHELGEPAPSEPVELNVMVGEAGLAREEKYRQIPHLVMHLVEHKQSRDKYQIRDEVAGRLASAIAKWKMRGGSTFSGKHLLRDNGGEPGYATGRGDIYGGIVYFPHDRQLGAMPGGPIEPPSEKYQWAFRFSATDHWQDSLEQLWVWQNYLDLERSATERSNLKPFVSTVEDVLGSNRLITVREGRALIPVSWGMGDGETVRVRLDQLPSGEQQVLLLFGELARRLRRGVVIAIDEIENCLHPTLQRQVMWNLRKLAREWDAQVIVATHSLEVIKTVRGGAFINLDYPEDRFDLPVSEGDREDAR